MAIKGPPIRRKAKSAFADDTKPEPLLSKSSHSFYLYFLSDSELVIGNLSFMPNQSTSNSSKFLIINSIIINN